MICKECFEDIYPDCMLTNNKCVFCHYKTRQWDSNGQIIKKKDAIIDYKNFFIDYVKYFKIALKQTENAFNKFPKGSIIKKYIKRHRYYYLIYRQNGKCKFDYIGKKEPTELIKKIKKRRKIKKRILEIKRLLYVLGEGKRSSKNINRYNILKRDSFACQYCGRKAPNVILEVDHIIPVSKGGSNNPSNLKTACIGCNHEKHNKMEISKGGDNPKWQRKRKPVRNSNNGVKGPRGGIRIAPRDFYRIKK